jgi:hypothetical protein
MGERITIMRPYRRVKQTIYGSLYWTLMRTEGRPVCMLGSAYAWSNMGGKGNKTLLFDEQLTMLHPWRCFQEDGARVLWEDK